MKQVFSFFLFSIGMSLFAGPEDTVKTTHYADSLLLVSLEDDPFAQQLDSLLFSDFFAPQASGDSLLLFSDKNYKSLDSIPDSVLIARMEHLNTQTPFNLTFNPIVKRYIEVYTEKRAQQVSRMLGLAEYYFPLFEAALDKYNMPLEIKYLAIVESALNPTARSYVGAKGLWQFMYATGKMYGLEVSSYVDERSDPIKSTEAACRYLTRLNEIYHDWNLALAAYNSGPGNVNKAIRRSGGKRSYWELRPYLPRETASYVPAFIAVNYAMAYAKEHGLSAERPLYAYHEVDTFKVKGYLDFEVLSRLLKIDKAAIKFLNPSYKHEIIPHIKGKDYILVLPKEVSGVFVNNEDSIYNLAQLKYDSEKEEMPKYVEGPQRVRHKVRSGETLGGIARKYGVRVSDIQRWNGLKGTTIRIGQNLTIYPRRYGALTKKEPLFNSSKTHFS